MNTDEHTGLPPLPELSDARIDEIEDALFSAIARDRVVAMAAERETVQKRARRRRTVWWSTAAAAVVVLGAVAIGPVLAGSVVTGGDAGSVAVDEGSPELHSAPDVGTDAGFVAGGDRVGDGAAGQTAAGEAQRQIIATAQAAVRVDDVAAAAQAVGAAAEARGGYVESMNVARTGTSAQDAAEGVRTGDAILPMPPMSGTWVTVRVPADQLTGAIDELSTLGTVESSSITREDVTDQVVDLEARVDALETSVDRLTALMGTARSVSDLLAAETALSQRQAELESYRQQLESVEDRVAMSSLTVSLAERHATVSADPAGFADGLVNGWNGLVAAVNGLVIGLGFLLPWLAVAAVAALIVWGIVRMRRRRRARASAPPADAHDAS